MGAEGDTRWVLGEEVLQKVEGGVGSGEGGHDKEVEVRGVRGVAFREPGVGSGSGSKTSAPLKLSGFRF